MTASGQKADVYRPDWWRMKKIDLGRTINTVANLGVIAGIVFLAVELRQNNEFMAAEARANRSDIRRGSILRSLNNPDLRRVRIKASTGEALDADEQLLIDLENEARLVDWQSVHLEYLSGLLDYDAIPVSNWRRVFQARGVGMAEY